MADPTPDPPHVYTLKELNAEGDAIQAFLRGEGPCLGCEERERERDEALALARRLAESSESLALAETHALTCRFKCCTCGAVEKRAEVRAELLRLTRSPSVLSLLRPAAPPR